MDRIEIPMEGDVARWVEAVERGDEVVFTRDGEVVAAMTPRRRFAQDRAALHALHAALPPAARAIDWGAALREARDEDRFP